MEIKIKNININSFFLLVLISSFNFKAQEKVPVEEIKESIIVNNFLSKKSNDKNLKNFNLKDPLAGSIIDVSRIVNQSNQLILETSQRVGDQNDLETDLGSIILNSGEFIQIREQNSGVILSDGSILIEFKEMPNFEDYAILNNLTYLYDLSDINVGVFKINNILNMRSKINTVKNDDNIVSISLNKINKREPK